jgi:hypothetical protein
MKWSFFVMPHFVTKQFFGGHNKVVYYGSIVQIVHANQI